MPFRDSCCMNYDRIGLIALLVVVVVTTGVFIWTSTHYQQGTATPDTHVDSAGHLHVLGLTLGETTLRQAESILQSKAEVALYLYPEGHTKQGLKMEAFFPSIADHTKVILLLDVGQEELLTMAKRASMPQQSQNGVIRIGLASSDLSGVYDARVKALTLIPSLDVSAENLKARFGAPDLIQKLEDEQILYRYDNVGLSATLGRDVLPTLSFSNPSTK